MNILKKDIWILAWIAVIGIGSCLVLNHNRQQPPKEESAPQTVSAPGPCHDRVQVQLGDVTLAIPREQGFSWKDMAGRETAAAMPDSSNTPNPAHPYYNCGLKTITGVWSIAGPPVNASVFNPAGGARNARTSFAQYREFYERIKKGHALRKFRSGLETFMGHEGHPSYVIPTRIIQTGNGEPILIYCGKAGGGYEKFPGTCRYTYYVTPQVILEKVFSRGDVSDEDFIKAVKDWRSYFESLILTGEAE